MPADVIAVAPTQRLQLLKKERRTRHAIVWIVHDVKSGTVLMAQKLQHVAEFANNHLSEARRERVTVQGLFEAADTGGNSVDGCHKMRYRVTRTEMTKARAQFDRTRSEDGVITAIILTDDPNCYMLES